MARTPDQVFEGLIEEQSSLRGIEVGKMFGSPVLKMRGRVFAMLVKKRLVVKLPKERVDKLLQSPGFKRFDPGHGKPSKEWVAVDVSASRRWRSLVDEAREFVVSAGRKSTRRRGG